MLVTTNRDGRVLGILEVSRSIGDGQYKRMGVCNTPDVKRCKITCNDKFVIVACDGLWKVYTNQQAVDFICEFVKVSSSFKNTFFLIIRFV